MDCSDWDEVPPSVDLLSPDGSHRMAGIPGGVFNGSAHPRTQRPFVCMRGIREFHDHPSHLNEPWASYRGQDGMCLVGLLDQLSTAWRRLKP